MTISVLTATFWMAIIIGIIIFICPPQLTILFLGFLFIPVFEMIVNNNY